MLRQECLQQNVQEADCKNPQRRSRYEKLNSQNECFSFTRRAIKTLDFAFLLYLYDPSRKKGRSTFELEGNRPQIAAFFRQALESIDQIERSGREKVAV
jgi:hypothetical protein